MASHINRQDLCLMQDACDVDGIITNRPDLLKNLASKLRRRLDKRPRSPV